MCIDGGQTTVEHSMHGVGQVVLADRLWHTQSGASGWSNVDQLEEPELLAGKLPPSETAGGTVSSNI